MMNLKSAAGLVLCLTMGITACSRNAAPESFSDFPALVSAIQVYSKELVQKGKPVPQRVSVSELVNGGYLSSNSVSAFDGMETEVWLKAKPADPQSVMMSARLSDGSINAALADGSVQQFSAERFEEHLRKTGQDAETSANQNAGERK